MTIRLNAFWKRFDVFRTALFFLGIAAGLSACDDPELIGLEVQPDGQQLGVISTDTFTMVAYTVPEDSVRTDGLNSQPSTKIRDIVGSYVDPEFGKTDATMYFQVRLSSENVDTIDLTNFSVDSVRLVLDYDALLPYGDLDDPQSFEVFRMTEDMDKDTEYFSNRSFTVDPVSIGGLQNVTLSVLDSVQTNDGLEPPQIRIPIDNALGTELLSGFGTQFVNNDQFLQVFKGIAVRPSNPGQMSGEGAMVFIDLESIFSRMTIFYRDNALITQRFDFLVTDSSARSVQFEHVYTGFPVADHLADSTLGEQKIYMQTMSSTKMELRLPSILNLGGGAPILINKAELILPLSSDDFGIYAPLPGTIAVAINENGGEDILPGFLGGAGFSGGGDFDEDKMEYRIRITRYLQDLLDSRDMGQDLNLGLRILPLGSAVNANRMILNGPLEPNNPMRLVISYTPLN